MPYPSAAAPASQSTLEAIVARESSCAANQVGLPPTLFLYVLYNSLTRR